MLGFVSLFSWESWGVRIFHPPNATFTPQKIANSRAGLIKESKGTHPPNAHVYPENKAGLIKGLPGSPPLVSLNSGARKVWGVRQVHESGLIP